MNQRDYRDRILSWPKTVASTPCMLSWPSSSGILTRTLKECAMPTRFTLWDEWADESEV